MFLSRNLTLLCQNNIGLNSTHYVIVKTPNKWELHKIAFNHLSDIDFKDFMNLYEKYTADDIFVSEKLFSKKCKD